MIEVHDLCRRYGTFEAVRDVSFAIGDREIVGLLGHNGAGKTTVMKMLTGYLEPDSGAIRIDGLDPAEQRRETQRRIGYLPENCPLYPELTVLETLLFQAGLRGIPRDRQAAAIRRAVERTALGDKAGAAVGTLSRGYRQRLGVAQAILHEPPILILDEPTNGLDPSQIQHMRELARELAASATLILSTHILQEVEAVCERVLIMRGGRLALDSTLDALGHPTRLRVVLDRAPGIALPLLSSVPGIREAIAGDNGSGGSLARDAQPKGVGSVSCNAYPESDRETARGAHPANGGTGERYCYALASADPAGVAPAVARAIAERGWNLHELTPERRELEALFGAVTLERMEEAGHV